MSEESVGPNELVAGILFATALSGGTAPYTGVKLLGGAVAMQLLIGHFQKPMFPGVEDVY